MTETGYSRAMAGRFRGYLPVVVDVETGGFDATTDALLEIAAVILRIDTDGRLVPAERLHHHVAPFPGSRLDPKALAFNGIQVDHPFRGAVPECDALRALFAPVRRAVKASGCTRAILVGHNAFFDLGFLNAAVARCGIKRNPFHPFSTFDTVTVAALAYGQTVLAKAVKAAGIAFDNGEAHTAPYDAEKTAELFCAVVNALPWPEPSEEEPGGDV